MQIKIDKSYIFFTDDDSEIKINCTKERLNAIHNAFSSYISRFEENEDKKVINLETILELKSNRNTKKYLKINLDFQEDFGHLISISFCEKTSDSDEVQSSVSYFEEKISDVKNIDKIFSNALKKYFPKKEIVIISETSSDSENSIPQRRTISFSDSDSSVEQLSKNKKINEKLKARMNFYIKSLEVLTNKDVLIFKRGIKIIYDEDEEMYFIKETKELSSANWCIPFDALTNNYCEKVEQLKNVLLQLKKIRVPLTTGKLETANKIMDSISTIMFESIEFKFCIPLKKERSKENFEEFSLSDAWEELKNQSILEMEEIKTQIFGHNSEVVIQTFENFYFSSDDADEISDKLIEEFKAYKKEAQLLKEMEKKRIKEIKDLEEIERVKKFIPGFENPEVSNKKIEPDEILTEQNEDLFLPNKRIVVHTNPEDLSTRKLKLEKEIQRIKNYTIRGEEIKPKAQDERKTLNFKQIMSLSDDDEDII